MVVEIPFVGQRKNQVFQETMIGGRNDSDAPTLERSGCSFDELFWVEKMLHHLEGNYRVKGTLPFARQMAANVGKWWQMGFFGFWGAANGGEPVFF